MQGTALQYLDGQATGAAAWLQRDRDGKQDDGKQDDGNQDDGGAGKGG